MSMGSFENTVRIALSTDDAAPINAVIERIRELEQVIRAMAAATADGTISNEDAVKGLLRYGSEINNAKGLLGQFLQQQAALDAGFETITGHVQASSDATKTFAKEVKDTASQEAEANALLNALIASGDKDMNEGVRREAKETADSKKKESSDWAAYSKHIGDLIAKAEKDTAAEIKQSDIDLFVHHLEMANARQQADVAALEIERQHQRELMTALGLEDARVQKLATAAIAAEAAAHAEDDLNQVVNAGASYADRHMMSWAGFNQMIDTSAISARNAQTYWQRFQTTLMNPALPRFLMFTAQGLEDLQFSFMAVVNNIPLVANEFGKLIGMSPNVAMAFSAIASVSGIAVNQIILHWTQIRDFLSALGEDGAGGMFSGLGKALDRFGDNFSQSFKTHADESVESLKKQLKDATKVTEELGTRTRLTAVEMDQYDKAKEKVAALTEELKKAREMQMLLEGKSEEEGKNASGFKKAFAETGPAAAKQDIEDAVRAFADASGKTYSKTLDRTDKPTSIANDLIVEAARGNARARDEIRDMLLQANSGDDRGLAGAIKRFSPEAQEGAKLDLEDIEAWFKAAAKDAKENRELTETGHERELEGQKEFIEKPKEDARKEADRQAKGVAGVFRPKLQEEIDLRAARMVKAGQTDDQIKAAIGTFVAERFEAGGVRGDLRGPAGDILVGEGMQRSNARIGAAGAVGGQERRAGAGNVVAEIEKKRADDAERQLAATERQRVAAQKANAQAGGLIPDADARLAGQVGRQQAKAEHQDSLDFAYNQFERMGANAHQAAAGAKRAVALFEGGLDTMSALVQANDELQRRLLNAEGRLMGLQRNMQRTNRSRTHLNRGGGVQPGP